MSGSLSVLNVGAGDIEVTFNHFDDKEAKRAITMLLDIQQRGYAVLVRDAEGAYQRAVSIDATRGKYVLTLPPSAETPADAEPVTCECGCGRAVKQGNRYVHGHSNRGKGKRRVAVPVAGRRATAVARSAGG